MMTGMDINVFNTFLEVAKVKHFGKAAENLYITQAAVSARIKNLEQHYNTQLFIRDKNNIRLTLAGKHLLDYAQIIVEQLKQAKSSLALIDHQGININIAATANLWDSIVSNNIMHLITSMETLNLGAEISVHESIHRRLLDKSLDIGLLLDPIKEDEIINEVITSLALVLVANPQPHNVHQLAQRYILVDWGMTFIKEQQLEHKYNPIFTTSSATIALNILLEMGGCAYLPMRLVAPLLENKQLILLESSLNINRNVYCSYHKNHIFTEQLNNIIQLFRAQL